MPVPLILFALGLLPGIPLWFFAMALPIVLREAGAPLSLIGLVSLGFLPYSVSFLWAPQFDRRDLLKLGRRRSWLTTLLALLAVLHLIAAALPPDQHVIALLVVVFAISFAGASLRSVTYGYAVDALPPEQHPRGTMLIGAGAAAAGLIGGSLMLLTYRFAGWATTLIPVAAILAVASLVVLRLHEPTRATAPNPTRRGSLRALLRTPGFITVLLFAATTGFGSGAIYKMLMPRLVDLGFGLEEIGAANGVITLTGWFIGGTVAVRTLRRLGLPKGLRWLIAGMVLAGGYMTLSAWLGTSTKALIALEFVVFYLGVSLLIIGTNSLFMAFADGDQASTDFTTLTCVQSLVQIGGGICGGLLADQAGYAAAFGLGTAFIAASVLALRRSESLPVYARAR